MHKSLACLMGVFTGWVVHLAGSLHGADRRFVQAEFDAVTDLAGMVAYVREVEQKRVARGDTPVVVKVNVPPGMNPRQVVSWMSEDMPLNRHGLGWSWTYANVREATLTAILPGCLIHVEKVQPARERRLVQREITLRLLQPDEACLFHGRVLTPGGQPAAGAIVRLADWAWMKTDEQGRFQFKAVSPGTLLARAETAEGEAEMAVTFKPGKAVEEVMRLKKAPMVGIRWTLQREPENPAFTGPEAVAGEAFFSVPRNGALRFCLERGAAPRCLQGGGHDFYLHDDKGRLVYRNPYTDGSNGLHEEVLPYHEIQKVNNGDSFTNRSYFYTDSGFKSGTAWKLGHVFTVRGMTKRTYAKMEVFHLPDMGGL